MANHSKRSGDPELQRFRDQQRKELEEKRQEMLDNNPVYQEKLKALKALIREGAQKADLTFPPYFKIDEMTGFRGTLLKRDDRDVKEDGSIFIRYHWRNTGPGPLECRRGKVEDGVVETVPVGGIFTTGHFGNLPFHKWFGFEVTVLALEKRTMPANSKIPLDHSFWTCEAHLMPEDLKRIESQDLEDQLFIIEAQKLADREAVREMARLNSAQRIGLADKLQQQAEERAAAAA